MKYGVLILSFIIIFVPIFTAWADSWNVELVGQTLGPANAVYTAGNYAYLCAGAALVILDVSNPSTPNEVGRIYTPYIIRGVYVSGSYAYVADEAAGLRVVNISNPTSPKEVGFYDTPGYAYGVYVSGSYAYVADSNKGLRVVNISNPANPQEVGFYDTPGDAEGVYVSGSYAYVADTWKGFCVVDISNPANPQGVGFYDTPSIAYGVYVSGSYAYVADYDKGLRVVNISKPANPQEVGFYDTPGNAYGIYVSGSYAYVADGGYGLRVVNISNPANPQGVGFYDTPGYAYGVYVSGNYAYVADYDKGLRVVNISNPANPQEVGFYDTPGSAKGVYVSGSYAYMADYDKGLRVVNISNPANPQEVGFYDTPGYAEGVYVSGSYVYVADYNKGLRVVNISNPANPQEVGFYDTPLSFGRAEGVHVSGSYAYLADVGLRVVNISNPANPQEVGFYDTPGGNAYGVYVSRSYAYVANWEGGLCILRFTGANAPLPNISLSAQSHNFGDVRIGSSADWNLVISSAGDAALTVNGITSDNPALVIATPSFPQTIPPNGSINVVIRFSPSEGKKYTGILTITSNDKDNPKISVSMEGNGTPVNDPPVVKDIPDQTIEEGKAFASIKLDDYVADPDNTDSEITWTYTGNTKLNVRIDKNRAATITVPDSEWNGSETITFTAKDPGGLSASDSAKFTVTPVNDPPVVKDIPDQTIKEGEAFASIKLDDYVSDPDNADSEITWTYTGNTKLKVSTDANRVATITVPNPEWNGSEIITFTAKDPGRLSASDSVKFTVTPVNEPPLVSDIPDQTVEQGKAFTAIRLDDYASDPDNTDAEITWWFTYTAKLIINIGKDHIATITVTDSKWVGSETVTFTARDPGGLSASDIVKFTVTGRRFLSITSVKTSPGAHTTVQISISDAKGIAGGDILIKYDTSVITIGEIKATSLLSNLLLVVNKDTPGQIKLSIAGAEGIPSGSGALVNIELVISANAQAGVEGVLEFGDARIYTESGAVVPVKLENGVVKIAGIKGDVNNDDEVRANDAILALQIAVEKITPTEYQKWAADMNEDGEVKANDAIAILRKAAGYAAPGTDVAANAEGPITIALDEAYGVAGGSISVPVRLDDVRGLAGGGICIAYDPAVLRAVGVSSDSDMLLENSIAEPGMVRVAFASSDRLNSKTLAEIRFDVLTDNVSPLTLKSVDLYNPDALPIDSRKLDGKFTSWAIPAECSALLQNFPNPFNPETWIPYQLQDSGDVKVRIYRESGELVRQLYLGYKPAGVYTNKNRAIYWDGNNETGEQVASGIYFYTIQAGDFTATKKMVIAR